MSLKGEPDGPRPRPTPRLGAEAKSSLASCDMASQHVASVNAGAAWYFAGIKLTATVTARWSRVVAKTSVTTAARAQMIESHMPDLVASRLGETMQQVGGDGFLFGTNALTRRQIAEICDGLVPELQRRPDSQGLRERDPKEQSVGVLRAPPYQGPWCRRAARGTLRCTAKRHAAFRPIQTILDERSGAR